MFRTLRCIPQGLGSKRQALPPIDVCLTLSNGQNAVDTWASSGRLQVYISRLLEYSGTPLNVTVHIVCKVKCS